MSTDNTDTDTDPVTEAEQELEAFVDRLREYDDPLVAQVADELAESSPLAIDTPEFTTEEWLDVLETTAGDLYLRAYESPNEGLSDSAHTWYCRHDGAAFIYGTKRTGELYRGDRSENAFRQVRAVIDGHDVTPAPMGRYPLEQLETDDYVEVPADAE